MKYVHGAQSLVEICMNTPGIKLAEAFNTAHWFWYALPGVETGTSIDNIPSLGILSMVLVNINQAEVEIMWFWVSDKG